VGFFDVIGAPLKLVGGVVGGLGGGLAAGSGAKNKFQATPYGYQAPQWVPGAPTGNPAIDNNPLLRAFGGHMQAGGANPELQKAFTYNDPNQGAYTTDAQGGEATAADAAARQAGVNAQQNSLAGLLTAQANGTGPSISALQLSQANDQARQAGLSTQASAIGQGVNPALAAQIGSNATAQQMQGNAATAAQGRVAEQLNGQQSLAGLLSAQAGQNLNQQQLGQQSALNFYGLGQQGSQFGTQSQMSLQDLLSNNFNAAQGINSGVASGNAALNAQLMGGILNAAGGVAGKMAG
jgi:hypothetical protein